MSAWLTTVCCLGVGLASGDPSATWTRFEFEQVEMSVPIKLVFYAPDKEAATRAAQAAFARIHRLDALMSDYDPNSELAHLAAAAGSGRPLPISGELWDVLTTAQRVSAISEGVFDVTIRPVVYLWRRARRRHELPTQEKIHAAMQLVGYQRLRLDPERRTAYLQTQGMQIDLGGIAKGYALAEALKELEKRGLRSAMVRGGGDLRLGEPPPDAPGWRIGVGGLDPQAPPTLFLCLSRCAVATSGDTWQYVIVDGKRYSHIVDPRTGVGLTDHSIVTLVGDDSALVDALSKVLSILGPEKGLPIIDAQPAMAAMVLRAPHGKPETHCSTRWPQLPRANSK